MNTHNSAIGDDGKCHGLSKSAGSVQTRQHDNEVYYKLVEMKSASVDHLNGLPGCEGNWLYLKFDEI